MAQDQVYDLIVLGGGSAGLVAAKFAGRLGVKVALVEMERLGGDCTWQGCVPSKALLKVAKTAHKNGTTLLEEAIALGFVDEETFNRVVRPENMIGPK